MQTPVIGIYRIRNRVNGKSYIGQSNDIKSRWERHISEETRTMISRKLKGRIAYNRGKAMSEEQKQKLREAMTGSEGPRKGAIVTNEIKTKISVSQAKRMLVKYGKGIKIVLSDNDIHFFVTFNEAAIVLTGKPNAGMAKLISLMLDNSAYIPGGMSKNWKILRDAKVASCSQAELLEHRPELK